MQFKLGSIPVSIRPPFLFLALVLGARFGNRFDFIAIWVAIVLVSVLIHELGHALVGRLFGLVPRIELHGMGGTTSWIEARQNIGHARSIAISLAGPFAGLAVAVMLWLVARFLFEPTSERGAFALAQLLYVNGVWSIFNLSPMLPLDGGNVVRSALLGAMKSRQETAEKAARIISILTACAYLVWALLTTQWWLGAMAAFFAWNNYQALRAAADPQTVDAA